MLALLYATGLRVSELVGLKTSNVNFQEGHLRAIGKGRKERLVPINHEALDLVRNYVDGPRLKILAGGQRAFGRPKGMTDALFVSRRGDGMNRHTFGRALAACARKADIRKALSRTS